MGGALRLLQAGGFRLDQPVQPVDGLPEGIRQQLIQAREQSARNVFDTALADGVHALVLTGELGDPSDPTVAWFLTEQFQRLERAGIDVVWASLARPVLPSWAPLPPNVRVLTARHAMGFRLMSLPCTIEVEWSSLSGEFQPGGQTADLLVQLQQQPSGIALQYSRRGIRGTAGHPETPIQRDTLADDRQTGMWLIDAEEDTPPVCRLVSSSAIHLSQETVQLKPGDDLEWLRAAMIERLKDLRFPTRGRAWLVQWLLCGEGPVLMQLVDRSTTRQLEAEVQRGAARAEVASCGIRLVPSAAQIQAWCRDEKLAVALAELDLLVPRSGPVRTSDLQMKLARVFQSPVTADGGAVPEAA